jgi:hypothetical protein
MIDFLSIAIWLHSIAKDVWRLGLLLYPLGFNLA